MNTKFYTKVWTKKMADEWRRVFRPQFEHGLEYFMDGTIDGKPIEKKQELPSWLKTYSAFLP